LTGYVSKAEVQKSKTSVSQCPDISFRAHHQIQGIRLKKLAPHSFQISFSDKFAEDIFAISSSVEAWKLV
jgi:hypothetical protein